MATLKVVNYNVDTYESDTCKYIVSDNQELILDTIIKALSYDVVEVNIDADSMMMGINLSYKIEGRYYILTSCIVKPTSESYNTLEDVIMPLV